MTESEWLQCTDPADMQHFLHCKVSERKWRLLACACCRRVWHLYPDERSRQGIAAVERFVDGQIDREELGQAGSTASQAWREAGLRAPVDGTGTPASQAWREAEPGYYGEDEAPRYDRHLGQAYAHAAEAVVRLTSTVEWWYGFAAVAKEIRQAILFASSGDGPDGLAAMAEECKAQCDLVREVVGNPFSASALSLAVLTWNDALVVRLAQTAYHNRQLPSGHLDPDHLAVLADALEEAGCQDEEILGHLRQPGAVHVRGCHVVDLLLAKE
jgi:hypothetical protein